MIKKIFLENFKSIKYLEMNIKPINILVGENSSGKSSVLQLLALLNQSSSQHTNFPHGDERNLALGDFSEILSANSDKMKFGLTFYDSSYNTPFKILWGFHPVRERKYGELRELKIQILNTFLKTVKETDDFSNRIKESYYYNNRKWKDGQPRLRNIALIDFTVEFGNESINESIEYMKKVINDFLERIVYIPPFRGIRDFGYPLNPRMPLNLGSKDREGYQETVVNIFNKWMVPSLRHKADLLNNALRNALDIEIESITPEISPRMSVDEQKPITSILVKELLTGVYSNIVNTGFGTNQMISMGVSMLYRDNPSLILIEEPEIHLHPRMQARVFDFINNLRGKNKVLITTHSDHFLVKVQQRIRQKKVNPNDIALYYFERTPEGATVSQRDIDKEGRIKGGMPGFFEHSLDELQEFIEDQKNPSK
ncbi:MAG: DUF3696 domain-containing protein [Candidatus Hodarchaeales archaeon]